jgi:hypothetical protein
MRVLLEHEPGTQIKDSIGLPKYPGFHERHSGGPTSSRRRVEASIRFLVYYEMGGWG